ncbi:MAG TPA: family 78 glycoside hydrolase catalytic domain [Candidatus Sulfotelmatobacter sp.]|jgi:alpha-L-rhamnosidase|nr:family 78 glycoside hydrolase catalytic domain [Candidatus Sulfotelmatobacter sp.]
MKRLFFVALLFAAARAFAAVHLGDLRCEHMQNPQGIDTPQPRLSWQLASSDNSVKQSAYQILVSSTEKNLVHDTGDLWDSGKAASDASILIPYAGSNLLSREDCFWKVRVWDENGKASAWSRSASWTMGILNSADWGDARWVGQDGEDTTNILSGTSWIWAEDTNAQTSYFRRVITIPADKKIHQAIFEYTGDNECRGWINGYDLGARNNVHTVKWNDITTRLESGKTYVFGFTGTHTSGKSPAGIIGRLTIEFTDGETWTIPTDEKWKVSTTTNSDWLTVNFDDSKWNTATVLGAAGVEPWGETRVPENRRQPARYLRKEFSVGKKVVHATVSFCGLGLSELYLNGGKIGDALLSPAFSQYDKRDYYVTYDVTKNLSRGANAMGVILGNGRFYADRSKVYAGTQSFGWPKLLLNLHLEFSDGSTQEVVSDGSWKLSTDGPILANNDYDGEEYDARREFSGWTKAGFEDSKWSASQIVSAPGEIISAQMQEPIRLTGTIKPVSVKEIEPGIFIYDLGQNMVGWCRIHVRGKAGDAVTLRHAETLTPDGSLYMANLRGAEVTDVYTLRGGGDETWEPRFVTHGFRFVEVTGWPGQPDLNAIEGRVVNDDLPVAGDFSCSNDILNRIYHNIVWGTRGNYRSLPTDCPQRDERQGWLGDRSEECKGESYLFDISMIYAKWRQDMADAQRTNGSIPDVAPSYWPIYSDNVTWPSSAIIIPSALERQFGDTASIGKNYDSARMWMDHMLTYASSNILSRDSYGDWCVPPEEATLIHSKDPARQTDKALLATSYFYYDLCLMEKYAQQLGKTDDATRWKNLAADYKEAFNEKFLDRQAGQYSNGTQTSCVLPLAFGLVPDDMKAVIFAKLVANIENVTKGHIGTGLIGGQYLNRVLADNGRADLAYEIASQRDYPSWGYMVEHGATTIWELWNGNTADPAMNSGNHVMLIGDLVVYFYEYLAGIAPASPGFKTIKMEPHLVGDLNFVKATHNSPYGKISSEWHRSGNKFDWQIEIPANTTAQVIVPAGKNGTVTCNGNPAVATLELGSGKYEIISQ